MSTDIPSIEIAGPPPDEVMVRACDLLDASNGLHFREWVQPDGQCYRWSGAAPSVRFPLRINRSKGNRIQVHLMRAFCDPPLFQIAVDGHETPVAVLETTPGIKLEAHVPASPQSVLVIEIFSRMDVEDPMHSARHLGFAFVDAHVVAG